MHWLKRIAIDRFLLSILLVVLIATLFPSQGEAKTFFKHATTVAIALLFFMHGAKLSRSALLKGAGHWRLHLAVLSSTFVLFPLLGMAMHLFEPTILSPEIYLGFLFLCALPGTVQAAIAFTSIAGGNVPAAIFISSASSILGVFLSPILVGLLMHTQGMVDNSFDAIYAIIWKLVVPFIIGHLSRPLIGGWIDKHRPWLGKIDSITILLVVYTAFSEAVIEGIWHKVGVGALIAIVGCSALLLAIVIVFNLFVARRLKFSTQDEITLIFCGSKKSLINGIPMANVLFPAAAVGIMVLPLMVFHQLQLMVCAAIAHHYARVIKENKK